MKKIGYKGYRFPPEIIQQSIWLYLRFTLSFRDVEDLLAERGITVSYETVRRWVHHFGPTIAADLRERRPKPHTTWHLDEADLKIDGRMVYLWRAVDAEGEVLDVLVRSRRDKHAALKPMRKLLKKYGFVADRSIADDLSRTTCGRMARQPANSGSRAATSAVGGRTIGPRIRISRPDEGSARCNASRAGLGAEVSLRSRRRLQHLQRPTPPRLCSNAPHLPRRGDERVARGGRGRLKIHEPQPCRVLRSTT